MANVGTAALGKTLIGTGVGASPTFVSIGTSSGLTAHGVVIAEGAGAFVATGVGTAGQVLTSNGAGLDPTFQNNTPSTSVQDIALQAGTTPVVPLAGTITFNGATVAAGTHPVQTNGTGANTMALQVQFSQAISSTNATNVGLSAFNSAQFSVDANGFVSSISGGLAWIDEATSFNAAVGNGYFVTAIATATLPASPSQGNTIAFAVDTASQLTITANTGQVIRIGSAVSASAGTAANNARGDSVTLVFRASDSAWISTSVIGTWTVT